MNTADQSYADDYGTENTGVVTDLAGYDRTLDEALAALYETLQKDDAAALADYWIDADAAAADRHTKAAEAWADFRSAMLAEQATVLAALDTTIDLDWTQFLADKAAAVSGWWANTAKTDYLDYVDDVNTLYTGYVAGRADEYKDLIYTTVTGELGIAQADYAWAMAQADRWETYRIADAGADQAYWSDGAAARAAYFADMAQAEHDWIDSDDQAAYDLALADLMTAFKGDQGGVDAQWDVDRSTAWKTYADAVYGDDQVAGPGAELVRSGAVSEATFDYDYGGAADYASFQTSLANLDAAQRSGEAETFKDALAAFAQSYQSPWAAKAAAEALARFNHEDALASAEAARKITQATEDRKLAQAQASAQQDKSNAEAQADADRIGGDAQAELDRATGLKAAVVANPSEANVEKPEDRLPAGLVRVELPDRLTPTAESTYFGSPGSFTYRSPQDGGTDGYGGHIKDHYDDLIRYEPDDVWDYGGYGGRAWWWMPPEDPEENPGPISELLRYMNVDHDWSDDTPYGGSAWHLGAEPEGIPVSSDPGIKLDLLLPIDEAREKKQRELLGEWAVRMMRTTPPEEWGNEVDALLARFEELGEPLKDDIAQQLRGWIRTEQANALQRKQWADAIAEGQILDESWWMKRRSRIYWMMSDPANRERIRKVAEIIGSTWKLNMGTDVCYRWVEEAVRQIKALGPEYWDNADYKIEMVEFTFAQHGGWNAHAMLKVTIKKTGAVFYFDDGVCGDSGPWMLGYPYVWGGIAFPNEVPKSWTPRRSAPLDRAWPNHSPIGWPWW